MLIKALIVRACRENIIFIRGFEIKSAGSVFFVIPSEFLFFLL